MKVNNNEKLWVEKYRPSTIEECVLPANIKAIFAGIVETKEIPNMILAGHAGTGKTTVGKALCNELDAEVMFINASDENGIDVIRTKIKSFASSVSLEQKQKVVILDEADYLNANSAQPALRAFIEEFSSNCRFIMTCNFKNKIIEPLQSRCTVIDFTINKDEKIKLAGAFMRRIELMLQNEGVEYNKKVIAQVIKAHYPDNRKIIGELQIYATAGGSIDEGILAAQVLDTAGLITSLKGNKFNDVRKWVVDNIDSDVNLMFRMLYTSFYETMEKNSIPHAVVLLADYQYKAAFVADQEINTLACLTEIMVNCDFE